MRWDKLTFPGQYPMSWADVMDENNDFEEYDDPPPYQEPSAINPSALRVALCKLNLLGDDLYLRMQAFNLAIVAPGPRSSAFFAT